MSLATPWARIGAWAIDSLLFGLIAVPLWSVFFGMILTHNIDGDSIGAARGAGAAIFVITALYGLLVFGLPKGAGGSPGYRAMKLRAVDVTSKEPIGKGRAFGRALVLWCVPFTPVSVLFGEKYRGWHDLAAGSVVVTVSAPSLDD